jgi:hypothetical protein
MPVVMPQHVNIPQQLDRGHRNRLLPQAADYSLVGCNTALNRKCTLDRQLWCWRAKSGNIDGVAGAVQTSTDGCSQYEITLLMQQMIVEMQSKQYASPTIRHDQTDYYPSC